MNKNWLWLDPKKITLAALLVLLLSLAIVVVVAAQTGEGFDLSWNVIGAGGGKSSGGDYSLEGTLGQTAVDTTSGSGRALTQGFWQEFLSTIYNMLPFTVKH